MKRLLAILLIIATICVLSACSGEHEHVLKVVAAKAATCTEGGNSEYYSCEGCGKFFTDGSATTETTEAAHTIAPLGHSYLDATCTEPKTCTVCGATEGEALDHLWSSDCDTACNREGCEATRAAKSHLDANEDDICDNCKEGICSDIPVGDGGGEFLPPDEF